MPLADKSMKPYWMDVNPVCWTLQFQHVRRWEAQTGDSPRPRLWCRRRGWQNSRFDKIYIRIRLLIFDDSTSLNFRITFFSLLFIAKTNWTILVWQEILCSTSTLSCSRLKESLSFNFNLFEWLAYDRIPLIFMDFWLDFCVIVHYVLFDIDHHRFKYDRCFSFCP